MTHISWPCDFVLYLPLFDTHMSYMYLHIMTHIFHSLVIYLISFRLFNGLTSYLHGIMDQCDHQINFSSTSRSVTYILWSSKFASCLEDYLLQKSCTWMIDQYHSETDIVNYMYILLYIIVINFKIFYN